MASGLLNFTNKDGEYRRLSKVRGKFFTADFKGNNKVEVCQEFAERKIWYTVQQKYKYAPTSEGIAKLLGIKVENLLVFN